MAPRGSNTSTTTRAAVVTLKAIGGHTSATVAWLIGLPVNQVNCIYARAIERGFDPNCRPFILEDEWLKDAPRSGRPTKQTPEVGEKLAIKRAKRRGHKYISYYGLTSPQEDGLQENEANKKAWTDEEDDGGTT
ncbi:hypothetical protein F4808DRAFT_444860 [Astrocystis sublimbata]|nr:hypothetical protein F4808DRAFT_444860 [Astrocystis sublimbata]